MHSRRPAHRLRRLALALAACLALFGAGCNTPSVPLPPPSPDDFDIGIASSSSLIVSSGPQPSRPSYRYEIFNENLGLGSIVRAAADGSFTSPPIDGVPGHRLEISYRHGLVDDDVSGILCVIVPATARRLDESDRCPD